MVHAAPGPGPIDATSAPGDAALAAFLPHLLHRLGNRLTAIEGLLELVVERGGAGLEVRTARDEAARAAGLVARAGLLGRVPSVRPGAVDVHDLLEQLEPVLREVAAAGAASLAPLERRGGVTVVGDPLGALPLLVLAMALEAVVGLSAGGTLSVSAVGLGARVALVVRAEAGGDGPASTRLERGRTSGESARVAAATGWTFAGRARSAGRVLVAGRAASA